MDFWGFERRHREEIPGTRFALLQTSDWNIGGAGGGGGGAAKAKLDVGVPPSLEKVEAEAPAGTPEDSTKVVIMFVKPGTDPAKISTDKTVFSVPGVFKSYGKPKVVDTEEEVSKIRERVSEARSEAEKVDPEGMKGRVVYVKYRDANGVEQTTRLDMMAALPAAKAANDDQASPITDFIANPSVENLQKINSDRAKTDRLIRMLLAALEQGGNLDVLMALFDLVGRRFNLTVAEVGARTARLMGMNEQQAAKVGENLQKLNMNPSDPTARANVSRDMQSLQLQLQQITSNRQQLAGMLQQVLEGSRSATELTTELRRKDEARRRAGLAG